MKTLVILTLGLSLVACSNLSTNSYNSKSSEHAREYDVFKSADNHGDNDFSSRHVENSSNNAGGSASGKGIFGD